MQLRSIALLLVIGAAGCASTSAPPLSPYAGQDAREIKSLSAEEVQGLLAGKGLGYAKPAELNGYPGPLHVLEIAERLELTAEQRHRTEQLFAAMQARAKEEGRALVEAERGLDRLFATRAADPVSVTKSLARIGDIQARVRAAHLEAHLAQAAILTPEQVAKYALIRGYGPEAHSHRH
ncbi:MAG TPA: periplasmic heavy metal sensor [Usitatibacter sp.]|nr:periplasmic heavy metal sensor [Usitatibacter sp.]